MARIKPSKRKKHLLKEAAILSCLEQTLNSHGISRYFYNLHGYSEDKLCLERQRFHKWILFYGCHGQKINKKAYTDIYNASRNIINQLADDENEAKQMLRQFDREIKKKIKSQEFIQSAVNEASTAPTVSLGGLYSTRLHGIDSAVTQSVFLDHPKVAAAKSFFKDPIDTVALAKGSAVPEIRVLTRGTAATRARNHSLARVTRAHASTRRTAVTRARAHTFTKGSAAIRHRAHAVTRTLRTRSPRHHYGARSHR